ncbi:hypothetical protein AMTRI_Chr02g216790 [Amborella trichopoda]
MVLSNALVYSTCSLVSVWGMVIESLYDYDNILVTMAGQYALLSPHPYSKTKGPY